VCALEGSVGVYAATYAAEHVSYIHVVVKGTSMDAFRVIAIERKFGKVVNRTMLGDVYSNVNRAKYQLRTWYGVKRFNEVADRLIVGSCRPRWHTKLTFVIAQQSYYEEIASYTSDELEEIAANG